MLELTTPVQYVKGVGPRIAEALAAKGISTVEDLLYYLPFRYEDRLNPRGIAELRPGEMATVIAEVRTFGLFYARNARFWIAQLTAGQGRDTLTCMWFRADYLRDRFQPGQLVALYGKVEQKKRGRGMQITQPQFEIIGEPPGPGEEPDPEELAAQSLEVGRIVPIYEAAGKLTTRWFRRVIHGALESLSPELPDGLPGAIVERHGLSPRRQAFWGVHFPEAGAAFNDLQNARTPAHRRLIYEELFFLEVGLELKRRRLRAQPGISFQLNERVREAIKKILPFHPTNAQKKVLREIAEDMARPSPMRRLLQGDVGSGKTIVGLQAAIIAIENGYQAALMAPTEILAAQHYLSARQVLENAGYRIVLLSGSMEDERKRDTRRHIARGDVQLVIGTHALIQEKVEFAKLGLVIVDEQHRFGVMQRFKLMKKTSELDPDVLVMTATPIPRTLALTLYGDLDVSVLDELPPGRTPIATRRVPDERAPEVWDFVRKQVAKGQQAFVVYPVIEETKQDEPALVLQPDLLEVKPAAELKAAVKMYDELRKKVFPDLRVGLLHGRLGPDEKESVMRRFQHGEIDVLVSTTVIEVGVDVANASVMVVEHAERFGLAQLHQLRGRIGRGAAKSYCILMTGPKVSPDAEQRLDTMVRTTDGFEIAEVDLALRGPGELAGTKQAGMPEFRVASLIRDRELLELAKRDAAALVSGTDAQISPEDKARALSHLKAHWQRRYGLVEVG
ncbi:MAG: ATP-dependent DNA helicase RecG [Acidobacteriia bacterium]|nr:ATP-dependent DNA helicase RecG [Terriglobia bacterium]